MVARLRGPLLVGLLDASHAAPLDERHDWLRGDLPTRVMPGGYTLHAGVSSESCFEGTIQRSHVPRRATSATRGREPRALPPKLELRRGAACLQKVWLARILASGQRPRVRIGWKCFWS